MSRRRTKFTKDRKRSGGAAERAAKARAVSRRRTKFTKDGGKRSGGAAERAAKAKPSRSSLRTCPRRLGAHALFASATLLVTACASREEVLPRPAPMAVHQDGSLSAKEQKRLGDVRRFLTPREQDLVEKSLEELATDPRLPEGVGEQAVQKALSTIEEAEEFCPRLAEALQAHQLVGPEATSPPRIAFAVPIERAHREWLVSGTEERFPAPLDLAKAIRDKQVGPEIFDPAQIFDRAGAPAFVTDAAEFDKKGPSAGGRLCLTNAPTHSYVIAIVATEALPGTLHVPTAADGVCRERFVLPEPMARAGVTCTGRPEYATRTIPLGLVEEIRLSR